MKVLGVENVDYVSRRTGNRVIGVRLHTGTEKRGCDGVAVENFFCKPDSFTDGIPAVGDEVRLLFNRWGSVQEVVIGG